MKNSLILYVFWHNPLKMCSKGFYLSFTIIVQLNERTHCWLHRTSYASLSLVTLVFSFVYVTVQNSHEFLILLNKHTNTHMHTHTLHLPDILIPDILQYYARGYLFWHSLWILCQNIALEYISGHVFRLANGHCRTHCIIPYMCGE